MNYFFGGYICKCLTPRELPYGSSRHLPRCEKGLISILTDCPDEATFAFLRDAAIILDALDADDAGAAQAWNWWRERFPDTWVRWPCVEGKDPNAMRLAGESVAEWVRAGGEGGRE